VGSDSLCIVAAALSRFFDCSSCSTLVRIYGGAYQLLYPTVVRGVHAQAG
jgi:hypothetical protein